MDKTKGWGSICVGTRLEKLVDSKFLTDWSYLLMKGLRAKEGDGFLIVRDRVAHIAANEVAHSFLKTPCDTLVMIDSDASFGFDIVEIAREFEPSFEYDIFQLFYTRRGWPPEAIWFKKDALGNICQSYVMGEGTEEVATCGTHFVFIRRAVFERMLLLMADGGLRSEVVERKDFQFFYYPLHKKQSEDATFSLHAAELGFKMGATSVLKVGHITRLVTGWETYQQFLEFSGQKGRIERMKENIKLVSQFLNEDWRLTHAKAMKGSENVRIGLDAIGGMDGKSAEEMREFYGSAESGYLYELIPWNSTVLYDRVLDHLREKSGVSALVVGGGIGGEVDALLENGKNGVDVFELPGSLRDFLHFKYAEEIDVMISASLTLQEHHEGFADFVDRTYDLITAIDTLEHFHPDEFEELMDAMLSMLTEGGELYFRNNFDEFDKYPMHFDHREAYAKWIEENDLICEVVDERTQAEVIRRKCDG